MSGRKIAVDKKFVKDIIDKEYALNVEVYCHIE